MSGLTRAYDVGAIASTYDPALHEAPIVAGHPAHDAPAAGWVASLSADGNELFGEPAQVDAAFAEAVEAGRYKKISASFYLEDSPHHPVRVAGGTPAAPYLRHVGFLGAQVPAVKGLAPVEFAEDEEGVATVEFAEADFAEASTWSVRGVLRMLRNVRNYIAGVEGEEAAEAVIPSSELDHGIEDLARQEGAAYERERLGEAAALSPAFSEPSPPDTPPTVVSKTPEEIATESADRDAQFAERERVLAEREAALHAQEAAAIREANAEFAEGLAADGARILPADVAAVTAALDQLSGVGADGATVEFGEGDEAEAVSPADALRRVLSGLPQRVDFGEAAAPSGDGADATAEFAAPEGYGVDEVQLALHQKAKTFQAEHPGTDYATAVRSVS